MSTQKSISAIIVNYNSGEHLLTAVAACVSQVDQVIVVDNASSDGSVEGCLQFTERAEVRIISNPTNLGFATACNLGVRYAEGDYLLFLNPDCTLPADSLDKLQVALTAVAAVGMVGGFLCGPDLQEQVGGRRKEPDPWRALVRATGLYRLSRFWPRHFPDLSLDQQPLPQGPQAVDAISGACMLVKRKAFTSVSGWDEGYFLHCEDLDLCRRLRDEGWRILFVPDAPVIHHKGGCSHSRPIFVEWHKHRGMVRYYRKFYWQDSSFWLQWLVIAGVWCRFPLAAGGRLLAARSQRGANP